MRRVHSKLVGARALWLALACLVFAIPIAVWAASSSDGQAAAERLSAEQLASPTVGDYVIGPQDTLTIRVFEVKDLSFDNEQVDSSGQIMLPLVGKLRAAGMTTTQLEEAIAQRLTKYLQSPQVTVSVTQSASLKLTVEGNVKTPGVYLIHGKTTLMQAVSMAGGPDDEADTHKVAIIRLDNGVRKAATIDYAAIKAGKIGDPLVEGDDVVVVGESRIKMVWANVMKNLPVFTLLAYLR